jgi:NAD(P)H-flavin reductase
MKLPFAPPIRARLVEARDEARRVRGLVVELPEGAGFRYAPGSHALLSLVSRDASLGFRPLSIASHPSEGRRIRFALRVTGEWSSAAERMAAGAEALLRGPYGSFGKRPRGLVGAELYLGAGIGMAALFPLIAEAARAGGAMPRLILWQARDREELFWLKDIEAAVRLMPGARFVPVLSHDPLFKGERGRISGERLLGVARDAGIGGQEIEACAAWICGPRGFMAMACKALRSAGARPWRLRMERFR